ncbi:MAG TPA: thiamine phosphate synthase [Candidatus Elarobacter sp.]|nr:thiamine phosphate synthase [Candidatus Elarobacter sp.]HEV2739393.1 thiamine phosphate synthase [Candidatus Elarobacter sp.]
MMTTRSGDAPRSRLRGIYALVDPDRVEPIAFTEALLRGGVRLIQIRAKSGIDGATLIAVVTRVRAAGGLAIVNDDVRLARLADGVHLGQEDAAGLDLRALRTALRDGIIGLSCGTPQEARAADPALIDYVGAGPAFATGSKDDAGLPIGLNGIRAVADATPLPCAAIGGIALENVARIPETGATMAAVLSALIRDAAEAAARELVERWNAPPP